MAGDILLIDALVHLIDGVVQPAGGLHVRVRPGGIRVGAVVDHVDTVGAGIEQSITKNLSFKTEYLYYDLGQDKLNVAVIPGSGGAGTGYDSKFKNDGQMLRVGLNWKFD